MSDGTGPLRHSPRNGGGTSAAPWSATAQPDRRTDHQLPAHQLQGLDKFFDCCKVFSLLTWENNNSDLIKRGTRWRYQDIA